MATPKTHPALFLAGTLFVPNPTPGAPPIRKVAQRVAAGLGNVPGDPKRCQQIRAHVIPYDPQTPAQLANRSRFAQAMGAWVALTPTERASWNAEARPLKISGMNLFVRKWTP